jgi:hypothetical protein
VLAILDDIVSTPDSPTKSAFYDRSWECMLRGGALGGSRPLMTGGS